MKSKFRASFIRVATKIDFASIRTVVHEVWPIAYRDMISQEQIHYMLEMMYSDESLQKQILDEGCTFLVYENDSSVLGFASYSAIENNFYKLHKLYVYSTSHGKGIGKALLDEVKKRVSALGGHAIELQVNKKNIAQQFYLKQGFTIDRELVLNIGNGFVMDDYIMRWSIANE
jgi:ribosomal protein S18 acetylase RimI-like enzyme